MKMGFIITIILIKNKNMYMFHTGGGRKYLISREKRNQEIDMLIIIKHKCR